jgi:transcriptional regulator with XRE-family HTH domain
VKTTNFAKALSERLEAKNWDIAELARRIDSSYEYGRQLVRGYTFPGKHVLKNICTVLDLDQEEMWKLVVGDKISKKYGGIPAELTGKDPRFLEIERLLPQLTELQFDFIVGAIEGIAKRNRHSDAVASSQSKPKVKVYKQFSSQQKVQPKAKVSK